MEQGRDSVRGKWIFILMLWVMSPLWTYAQRDYILLRDGSERKVKIVMVRDDNTIFTANDNSSAQESIPNTDIYMIKYQRGNVFFTEEGERFSGEGDGKIPQNSTAIYLLKGKEIIGYNVEMGTDQVRYTPSKKKGKDVMSIDKSEIFLIVYPDKTKDMLNDFAEIKRKKEEALAEQRRQEEEARLAELRSRYPKDATIKTVKNLTINVSLLSEDDEVVTYKKKGTDKSPIFHMNRTNIKEIMYNQ